VAARRRQPVRYAEVKDVRKAAKSMDDAFVHCRTMGHVWAQRTVEHVKEGFFQVLGCKTCPTTKEQVINRRGEIIASKTNYAEGYLIKGLGRLRADTKSVLRLESVKRYLKEADNVA
jgi:hypothetical protein